MTTAEDLNIKIFYQDTDSMHIEKSRLHDLEVEFKRRFNRELVGKDLGQFHSDFDELENSWAYKSIFCGKKCYVDMLTNETGKEAVHRRAKGVTLTAIDKMAKEQYGGDIFKLYQDMADEHKKVYDMKQSKACLKNNKNRQVSTCPTFSRGLLFKGSKNICYSNYEIHNLKFEK